MLNILKKLSLGEEGAVMTEYVFLVVLITLAVVLLVSEIGMTVKGFWERFNTKFPG